MTNPESTPMTSHENDSLNVMLEEAEALMNEEDKFFVLADRFEVMRRPELDTTLPEAQQ